jgi:hypothetical protein
MLVRNTMATRQACCLFAILLASIVATPSLLAGETKKGNAVDVATLVGKPADMSSSAYQYRADRKPEENDPESWIGLMQFLGAPQDRPLDMSTEKARAVLCSLLWEEVRPIDRVALSWSADAKNGPASSEVALAYLDASDGNAHFWWNPIDPVCASPYPPPLHPKVKWANPPEVSADGLTYTFAVPCTWSVVACLRGGKHASAYAVPVIRALTPHVWKKSEVEIEWGFDRQTSALDYGGRIAAYDGIIADVQPLAAGSGTLMTGPHEWRSAHKNDGRRGIRVTLLHIDSTAAPQVRTIVTVWTKAGNFSFKMSDAEKGPILAPEYGFFVRANSSSAKAATARDFVKELAGRGLKTVRQRVRERAEMKPEEALAAWLPKEWQTPFPPPQTQSPMQMSVPDAHLTNQWKLGAGHLLVGSVKDAAGKRHFNDHPYGILGTETFMILHALDVLGLHREAADGLDQWLTLPMNPVIVPGQAGHHTWARPDRPLGLFSDGKGCLTHAVGPDAVGDHMDGVHCMGPGTIMFALSEHFRLTGDMAWLKANAPRMKANAEWIVRQRKLLQSIIPGGERLWCKGLQPAHVITPDVSALYQQFYTTEAYYYLAVKRMAELLNLLDPAEAAKMAAEAEAYRRDLLAALERSITLTPVICVQDGTYHSYIPFAVYVRGPAEDASYGWMRSSICASYWDLVQSAGATISPAGVLAPSDPRVQGCLDVVEDRLAEVWTRSFAPWIKLFDSMAAKSGDEFYYFGGVGHQAGFERPTSIYLETDDFAPFLRGLFVGYAAEVVPTTGYTFMEGAPHYAAPNKIFEEAAFLVRFRSMLIMEDGPKLWLARATPRAWLEHGRKIAVKHAPTHFGDLAYEIVSDADHGKITATLEMPSRNPPKVVLLRLRHPKALPIKGVTVNGEPWEDFDPANEVVRLHDVKGKVELEARY